MAHFNLVIVLGIISTFLSKEIQGCDPKYQIVNPDHTACLNPPTREHEGVTEEEKRHIVSWHNEYRGKVSEYGQPSATDMQKMVWDDELAFLAQKWAGNCIYMHESGHNRAIPGRFAVGQNLAWTKYYHRDWNYTLYLWQAETEDFVFGVGSPSGRAIGHYTQMVWNDTSKVGCGYAYCNGTKHYYVCNYGPAGNLGSRLYEPYTVGTTGKDCAPNFDSNSGLCDCNGMACQMGGSLDLDTCSCECGARPWIKEEGECTLDCSQAADSYMCATNGGPWTQADCGLGVNVAYDYCPVTCNWCPAGGVGTGVPLTSTVTNHKTTLKPTVPPSSSMVTTKVFTTVQTSTGLAPCKEVEEATCGQPSSEGYYPRSLCEHDWMSHYCPAMCGDCEANKCKDYSGNLYNVGETWITQFGQMKCTFSGVIVEKGCMRDGRFIPIDSSLTYDKDGIRWTCRCETIDASRQSLKCTGQYI